MLGFAILADLLPTYPDTNAMNTSQQRQSMNAYYMRISQVLTDSVSLSLPPIATTFASQMLEGIRNWTGRVPAGFRFWQEAGKEAFATVPTDHDLCGIGTFTHNLVKLTTRTVATRSRFSDLGYVREQDIASIPVLKSRPSHVVYGPLAAMPVPPNVVLLFGKPAQLLILSEASQQVEGGLPPAMGRPAYAIVPQAYNTGRAALTSAAAALARTSTHWRTMWHCGQLPVQSWKLMRNASRLSRRRTRS